MFLASYITVALGRICIVGELRLVLSTNIGGKWLRLIPFFQCEVDIMVSVRVYNVQGRAL